MYGPQRENSTPQPDGEGKMLKNNSGHSGLNLSIPTK
ncbi:hypothetical protein BACCAP_04376 [Pseudoflavonifractor capillosus ATCC 29799]|uniref:Uncharacterized protein n=1 Tax=Pseudoflavonifractor capillosus ATCC 29799 TaxID=411467 RepID=A6P1K9_9FIRM|nr:hypothetical protein BACCAP_04376 [Pseudoflavonifractor capillosus ATCC 29799]